MKRKEDELSPSRPGPSRSLLQRQNIQYTCHKGFRLASPLCEHVQVCLDDIVTFTPHDMLCHSSGLSLLCMSCSHLERTLLRSFWLHPARTLPDLRQSQCLGILRCSTCITISSIATICSGSRRTRTVQLFNNVTLARRQTSPQPHSTGSSYEQSYVPWDRDLITVARVLFTHQQPFKQQLTPRSGADLQPSTRLRFTKDQQHGQRKTQHSVHHKKGSAELGRVVVDTQHSLYSDARSTVESSFICNVPHVGQCDLDTRT